LFVNLTLFFINNRYEIELLNRSVMKSVASGAERLSADLDNVLDDIYKETLKNGVIDGGIRKTHTSTADEKLEVALERKELNSVNERKTNLAEQLTQGFTSITGNTVVDKLVTSHINDFDVRQHQQQTPSSTDSTPTSTPTPQQQQPKSHIQRLLQIQEDSWSPSSKAKIINNDIDIDEISKLNAMEIIRNRERIASLERDLEKENNNSGTYDKRVAAKAQAAHARSLSRPRHVRPKSLRKKTDESSSRRKSTSGSSRRHALLNRTAEEEEAEGGDSEVSTVQNNNSLDDGEGSTFYDESLFDILDQL